MTGKTLAENVADAEPYAPYPNGQDLVRPFNDPIKPDSHLRILYGNLAADGAVAKITGTNVFASTEDHSVTVSMYPQLTANDEEHNNGNTQEKTTT